MTRVCDFCGAELRKDQYRFCSLECYRKAPKSEEHKEKLRIANYGNQYSRGYKHKESTKKLLRKKATGRTHNSQTREKLRNANLGKVCSDDYRILMSLTMQGKNRGNKGAVGTKRTEAHKKIISEAQKGNQHGLGTKRTEETKRVMSEGKRGENNPAWLGGISFGAYGLEFNEELKSQVKEFWGYTCQYPDCGVTQEEHIQKLGYGLAVHHIDYDKHNNDKNNLIPLCSGCNLRVNHNRAFWIEYFSEQVLRVFATNGIECEYIFKEDIKEWEGIEKYKQKLNAGHYQKQREEETIRVLKEKKLWS